MKNSNKPDNSRLPNYFALISIAPALLAVMAYEFANYMIYLIRDLDYPYNPIDGIAILVPMALLMELFSFFLSRILLKKVTKLTDGIQSVASGDYTIKLDSQKLAPFTEVAEDFNKMAKELSSVETLRSNFIKDFSHEFKTPIVSIKGFADLLLEGELAPEEEKEYLTIIAEESSRLSHLAEQTLLMSKLDSQSILSDMTDYDLAEQVRQCVILLSPQWDAKHIELDIELEQMPFLGNKELMSHVWINVINNAIKFTPENGKITITGKLLQDRLLVTISDTGMGMEQSVLANIFNRYYQGDSSHSGKGLGLGLSIAKKIVSLCDGEIYASSTVNVGSTFTINLPARK